MKGDVGEHQVHTAGQSMACDPIGLYRSSYFLVFFFPKGCGFKSPEPEYLEDACQQSWAQEVCAHRLEYIKREDLAIKDGMLELTSLNHQPN